jgi:hypothetical protein
MANKTLYKIACEISVFTEEPAEIIVKNAHKVSLKSPYSTEHILEIWKTKTLEGYFTATHTTADRVKELENQ